MVLDLSLRPSLTVCGLSLKLTTFYHIFRIYFKDDWLSTCTFLSFLPHPILLVKGLVLVSPYPRHQGHMWATASLKLSLGSHRKKNGHPSIDYCPDGVDQLSSWS